MNIRSSVESKGGQVRLLRIWVTVLRILAVYFVAFSLYFFMSTSDARPEALVDSKEKYGHSKVLVVARADLLEGHGVTRRFYEAAEPGDIVQYRMHYNRLTRDGKTVAIEVPEESRLIVFMVLVMLLPSAAFLPRATLVSSGYWLVSLLTLAVVIAAAIPIAFYAQ